MQIVGVAEGVAHLAQLLPNCSYTVWLQVNGKDVSNCSFTTPPGPCRLSSSPLPLLPSPSSPSLFSSSLFLPHCLVPLITIICMLAPPSLPVTPPLLLVNISVTTLNGAVQLHWTLPQGAKVELYIGDHWIDVTLGGVVTSLGNLHSVVVMVTLGSWTATSLISVPTDAPGDPTSTGPTPVMTPSSGNIVHTHSCTHDDLPSPSSPPPPSSSLSSPPSPLLPLLPPSLSPPPLPLSLLPSLLLPRH